MHFIKYILTAIIRVVFSGDETISEGNAKFVTISYQGTITQSFMVTVESYPCNGSDAATRMYYK